MQPLPDAGGGVHALVVTPDETMLFAGCADGTIASWSVPDGTRRDSLSGHKTGVIQLGITPDGAFLCSEGADGAVRVWALPGGEMVHELQGNEHHPVLTVGSPDRSVFLTNAGAAVERRTVPDCAVSGTFDEGGLLSGVRERTGGSRSFVSALRVTPDGSLLAAAHAEPGSPTSARNRDNAIRLWDVEASRLLGKLQGHLEPVDALAITADSRILCSGAEDGTIRLWSLPAGEALNSLIDLEVTPSVGKGRVYTATNMYGTQVRYTLPCGSPIPPGAVCSCDCVPGSYAPPVRRRSGGGRICTCNRICTCVPIK
jgi:WD40 repeat protein